MGWNKPKWDNIDDLNRQIDAYFKHCKDTRTVRELKNGDIRLRQETPTMCGLANWLNVNKSTIYNYLANDGDTRGHSEEAYNAIVETLSRAQQQIEQGLVDRSLDGDCDSRIGGMLLTAFGYNDNEKQPTAITVSIAGMPDAVQDWAK